MIGNEDERTVMSPEAAEATVAFSPAESTVALGDVERTQMAVSMECPVCHTTNPPGEMYCGDCGFLLTSTPGALEEEAAAPEVKLTGANGLEFNLNLGENTVGRANADILLADATVSRRHALVGLAADRSWVEDLGSTNGTKVNGQRLEPNQARDLANGDEIQFGSVVLKASLPEGFVAANATEAPEEAVAPVASPAVLVVEETGTEYPLPVGTTTLGRRSVNNIAFTEDHYISGRHAEIAFDGEQLTLTDLGSTNGTIVNDDRLVANTPQILQDGDLVVLGQKRLRVRFTPLEAEGPADENVGEAGTDESAEAESSSTEE